MKRLAHVIKPRDRGRIVCDHPSHGSDGMPAVMCEHSPHAGGVSFFHYCADCWLAPAANGGPSAAERTGTDLPDALDYERRWLAECRAHGETQRRLAAAQHELGDHSLCSTADCDACTCATGGAYLCLRCERIAESQDIGF